MELRIFPYETQKRKDLEIQQNKKRRNKFKDMRGGEGGGGRKGAPTQGKHDSQGDGVEHSQGTGSIETIQGSSQVFQCAQILS